MCACACAHGRVCAAARADAVAVAAVVRALPGELRHPHMIVPVLVQSAAAAYYTVPSSELTTEAPCPGTRSARAQAPAEIDLRSARG